MQIAVKTSGRGPQSDYTWKSNSASDSITGFLESMCGQGHGCTVARRGGAIDAYFSGFKSGLFDFRNRDILVSVAILGISETKSRALLLRFIEDHSGFRRKLLESLSRPSPDVWVVDYAKLDELGEEAMNRSSLSSQETPFSSPRSDDFNDKEEDDEGTCAKEHRESRNKLNLERLCQEIRDHSFSEGDGLKLILAATPPDAGYKKALLEADRLLWAEGSKDDLLAARKKKEPTPTTFMVSTKSGMPSSLPTCASLASFLMKFLFLKTASPDSSNPAAKVSPGKLSIICGVAAAFVIGATVGYKWRGASAGMELQQAVEQAHKEKDLEWQPKMEAADAELRALKTKYEAVENELRDLKAKNLSSPQVTD